MPTTLGRVKGFPTSVIEWDGKAVIRVHEDQYEVQADNETQISTDIIDAFGIKLGDEFPGDPHAKCKKIGKVIRSTANRLIWFVPVIYTSQFPTLEAAEVQQGADPSQRRLKRFWTSETIQVAQVKDAITGDPLVNSANEPIEQTIDVQIPVLTVEKYAATFSETEITTYANHVNAAAFYGAPAKTALMSTIEAEEDPTDIFEGDTYRRIRYVIKFRIPITEDNKGWYLRAIDQGTVHTDAQDPDEFVPYLTSADSTTGNIAQRIGPLDGVGGKLATGSPLFILPDDTGFNTHKTADFDALNIGPTD